jgi:CTP:molybdopterin cytidylyltransferase MocA
MTDHIIVLAAGRGTRAGGPKALHRVGDQLWWQLQARRLSHTQIPARWVVSDVVARAIHQHNSQIHTVRADDSAPMFASILAGVQNIKDEARGVFILPVDVPAPHPDTFRRLAEALSASSTHNAAVPSHDGKHGHPIYLPWRFVRERLLGRAHSPDDRLDRMIEASRLEVPVDDPCVLLNLNTAADFAELSRP